jgi:hypothetical protein
VANVQAKLNDDLATDAVVTDLLEDAQEAIFLRMYPFGVPDTVTDVPARYQRLQCKLAVRYFNRIGADGETVHLENGIHHHYGSANDEDLLQEVMQVISF